MQTWQEHVAGTEGWSEEVLYVGVGTYVRPECPHSIDQQLPAFLGDFLRSAPNEEKQRRARAILVDPHFGNGELPLAVRADPSGWKAWCAGLSRWDHVGTPRGRILPTPHTYKKERLILGVITGFVEYTNPGQRDEWEGEEAAKSNPTLIASLYEHAREVLRKGEKEGRERDLCLDEPMGWVWIGVYCHPYYANEDNLAVLDLYHALLDDYRAASKGGAEDVVCRLQGFVLADYADGERGTRVWLLNGQRHDQDLAVMKEVARFQGAGLNASIPEYVFMQRQYGLGVRFGSQSHTPEEHKRHDQTEEEEGQGQDVLARTQVAVAHAVERAGGRDRVLAIDEIYLHHLPPSVLRSS